jgi:hypothetical protein
VPLLPALAAMTALQMLISCAMMAPAVMAPRIGIDAATLGLYATAACVVGMLTTFVGGVYAGRYGSFRVATGVRCSPYARRRFRRPQVQARC